MDLTTKLFNYFNRDQEKMRNVILETLQKEYPEFANNNCFNVCVNVGNNNSKRVNWSLLSDRWIVSRIFFRNYTFLNRGVQIVK